MTPIKEIRFYVYHTAACFGKLVWPPPGSLQRGLVLSHTFFARICKLPDGGHTCLPKLPAVW